MLTARRWVVVFVFERLEAVSRILSFRHGFIRPQGAKNGAIFAIMVDLNADVRNRGTNFIALWICHGEKLYRSRLVQFRGTNIIGQRNLSRCKTVKAGWCGYPGTRAWWFIFGAGSNCKNCDKKITTTVRVIASDNYSNLKSTNS